MYCDWASNTLTEQILNSYMYVNFLTEKSKKCSINFILGIQISYWTKIHNFLQGSFCLMPKLQNEKEWLLLCLNTSKFKMCDFYFAPKLALNGEFIHWYLELDDEI